VRTAGLLTRYLQQALGLFAFAAGLVFGIPGLGSVVAGVIAQNPS
jgi:hypothetical protein